MRRNATISTCGHFRCQLGRYYDEGCNKPCCAIAPKHLGYIAYVLNNPSTASEEIDDPTIRRLWGFTVAMGYGAMQVFNTNPYRSTVPHLAIVPPEPVMKVNDQWLEYGIRTSAALICGWGDKANDALARRAVGVLHGLGPMGAFRVTAKGNPQHPLYLPAASRPQQWSPKKWLQ